MIVGLRNVLGIAALLTACANEPPPPRDPNPSPPPAAEASTPADEPPPADEPESTVEPPPADEPEPSSDRDAAPPPPLDPDASTSIGSPTFGELTGGAWLAPDTPDVVLPPKKDPQSRYGTAELVGGVRRAATALQREHPGAPITIGDLSRPSGGVIKAHASHRSGRDVDVLLLLLRQDGSPFSPAKFIPLDPQGRGTDYGDLADPSDDVPVHLDVTRTWAFVAALLADEDALVQKVLIAEHLRTLLLAEAARVDAPEDVVQRFSEVTCQPRFPHDDHMHIRVFCTAQDIEGGCEDTTPVFGWRRRQLAAAGVKWVKAGTGPHSQAIAAKLAGQKPALKTLAQAKAEAGPMHRDVEEFLERREAWASKPHPGRRYCR